MPKPEFTEEEEHQIRLAEEARYRAAKRLREEERKEKCESGEHVFKDGKCRYCQAAKPPEPEPKKANWAGW